MSQPSYSFDEAAGIHRLSYVERVPSFWTRDAHLYFAGAILAVIAFLWIGSAGASGNVLMLLILAILFLVVRGVAGFFRSTRFPVEIRANAATGEIMVDRSWRRQKRGGPARFDVCEVASIERVRFASEHPDVISALGSSQKAQDQQDLAEAQKLEVINIVLTDGQVIEAGWHEGGNKAAVLQKTLINLMSNARASSQQQRQQAQQRANLRPGDALL